MSVSDAEKMAVRSMQMRRRVLGTEHEDTLSSMAMAGLAKDIAGTMDRGRRAGGASNRNV